jgi:hypothetical protein
MKTSSMQSLSKGQKPMDESALETTETAWKPLYKVGAVAALAVIAIIVIQAPSSRATSFSDFWTSTSC